MDTQTADVGPTILEARALRTLAEAKVQDFYKKFENNTPFESDDLFFIMGFINDENIEGLRHLKERGVEFSNQKSFPLIYAAREGRLEAVRYFIEEVGLKAYADDYNAFKNATITQQNDVAKYLMQYNLSQEALGLGLLESAANGNIEMVEHLTSNNQFAKIQLTMAFEAACLYEQKQVAEHLYMNHPQPKELDDVLDNWAKNVQNPKYKIQNVKRDFEEVGEVKQAMDQAFKKPRIRM
ncbi:ankyrin repeat domain-containing protein [Burkholderia cenocepacia]|uniref:ankyrin repeat domain-containing protein n=1 Tax=Burkholderia cenocepacia TaxID=95486 RepID=UPI00223817B4|nr:ankyrin repeat domain-containing protein [Burkholderia cenocepacia]MCW5156298.1 ankyrin repeat domain-containing protein [Burkholderia cenocepacia]